MRNIKHQFFNAALALSDLAKILELLCNHTQDCHTSSPNTQQTAVQCLQGDTVSGDYTEV